MKLFSKQVSCTLNNEKVDAVLQRDQNHKKRGHYNVALNPTGSKVQKNEVRVQYSQKLHNKSAAITAATIEG